MYDLRKISFGVSVDYSDRFWQSLVARAIAVEHTAMRLARKAVACIE